MGHGTSRWYRIGLMLFLMYLAAFIDRSNIGMAAPAMMKSFGLSSVFAGVLLSAFFWGYVITQVPGGLIAAKYSAKTVILVVLIVWGITAILTGLAQNFTELIIVRVIMGLAEGAVWPAFAIIIANWFPDQERGKAAMLSLLSLPLSSVIMAPIAGWMIYTWNYHVMFVLQGIPPIIFAIIFWRIGADSPAKATFLSADERDYLLKNQSTVSKETGNFAEVIGDYRIWILGIAYFLWINGFYSFGLWMPTIMKELTNRNIMVVGFLTAIPFVFAALAMYLNARWSDKHGVNRGWFVTIPLLIGGIALVIDHFVGPAFVPNMVLLIVAGIGLYAAFGPWWAWTMTFFPRNQSGSALGFINMVGNFGGITGPIFIGLAAGKRGELSGFYVLGIALIISFVLLTAVAPKLYIKRPQERDVAMIK